MKTEYYWLADSRMAKVILTYKNQPFIGTAKCAPEDEDYCSKFTGFTIAESRAKTSILQFQKKELKIKLEAIAHVYYNLCTSSKVNFKSHEMRTLRRQLTLLTAEIQSLDQEIRSEKAALRNYLKEKDQLHSRLRVKQNSLTSPAENA